MSYFRIFKKEMISIDENKLDEYVIFARDASFRTGVHFFNSNNINDKDFYKTTFWPFTLIPSPIPKKQFDLAISIQTIWNELFMKFSKDLDLIYDALKDLIKQDDFFRKHWEICKKVNKEKNIQKVTLNIMRIDYLIDKKKLLDESQSGLSQVEINSFACGGCGIPQKIKELHKYMLHITNNNEFIEKMDSTDLYENIIDSLLLALSFYNNPKSHILFVIRDKKYTYSDHRLIEYKIFEKAPNVKFFRLTFTEIIERAVLDDQKKLFIDGFEIGLVYYKSGFDPKDYPSDNEWNARLMMEISLAIKAPRIEFQLLTTKKFQQYIYEHDIIEKYIKDQSIIDLLRSTFVKQYCFQKDQNKTLFDLINRECNNWVLKSQAEGGGHNLFGEDIKKFIFNTNEEELVKYILMEKIDSIEHSNYIIHQKNETKKIQMNSELGVFGIIIGDSTSDTIYFNKYAGCLLKSKHADSNEGGIMIGRGAFDSLYFI